MRVQFLFSALLVAACAYGQTVEFAGGELPVPSVHASTVVELPNGDLMAAWFGGTREGAADVAIWGSRRTSAGWSAAKELVREPNIAAYNPVLFYPGDGLLWLYYKFGPSPGSWSAGRMSSRDAGVTWSVAEHLPAGLYGPIRAKPLVMADGTILSGTSVESYGSWACWVERSTDHGRTWRRIGPIAAPASLATRATEPGKAYGIIQPSLISMGGRHVRMYARSTPAIGRIVTADSMDGGLTWSEVRVTSLPNPNSGIDAVRLKDGRVVVVYNRSTSERTPLKLAVSTDGEAWRDFMDLETEPGEFSYPAMVQARNGDLLITYTWQRKNIRFVRVGLGMVR